MSPLTTKITDLLDQQGIPYRLLPHSEPVYTVEDAAAQRGVRAEEMVKSILLRDKDGHFVMACVAGNAQLDPKAVRAHVPADWRRLYFASGDDIKEITGCVQGAVAPLALPVQVPVLFDCALLECENVNISSGDPTAGLELDPKKLVEIANARIAPIAKQG